MGKRINEMSREKIINERKWKRDDYSRMKEDEQVLNYNAINESINRITTNPIHRSYLKLGVLLELEK